MNRGKRRLKILYVVSIMPPYPGGAAVDYASFVSGLGGERFIQSVESVTVLTEKGCARDYPSRVRIKDSLINYDTAARKSHLAQLLNYMSILWHILFGGYDVVHVHARYVYGRYIGRVVWLALVVSRAAAFVDLRDRFYNGFVFGVNFIVCSDALKEYYSRVKRPRCVPVPMTLGAAQRVDRPGRNLAYFGTIAASKGVMELIDGFARYRREGGGLAELHVYGANAMGDGFLRAIEGRVGIRYLGAIESSEVMKKIPQYAAVVLPSVSEGMPRVCLETISCERVIVCHRNIKSILPCIPDEFVLNDLTPGEFARVLKSIEKVEGPVAYGYDFSVHRPESVCSLLVRHYDETSAYGRHGRDEGGAHLIKRRG